MLSLKEKIKVENVLENFDKFDDLYLLRFLRARKFDLKLSFEMFKKFIEWRQSNEVDKIRTNYNFTELKEVKKIYPHGYHQTDRLGRPIYIELICKVNIDNFFAVTTEERAIKYYIKEFEFAILNRLQACSRVKGQEIEQSVNILDVEGLGMGMLTGKVKKFLQMATSVAQDNYPETLGAMYLINSSTMFSFVFNIVKGFIEEKTRNKINVIKANYKEKLLEIIDENNLPSILGGKCTCSHVEGGCMSSDIGPWNPLGIPTYENN